ncbi:SpoIIE family protein phosphatase [Hymenobacter sp. 15J16-1T3B]|uniref:GAF domain-containing SpoIIE family protein phosphatase n=1 Tax=Hymenobacter sp. 15J16-1T3B TaxID=2886941 RepID=UPI001D0F725F|nr:GAF domain-containing SpoIIE family protein phosphatase [Hymenobacter sp. 15J16-1T3B]MCC3157612.1 SpoIIE family protein phosphatase [Hymenobacter sp. 15J16-1T3B]
MIALLRKLIPLALPLAVVSWLGLLVCMLLRASPAAAARWGTPPDWVILTAQALFAAGIFLHERARPDRLRGTEFVPLLRQLLVWPGALAAVCVLLHLTQHLLAAYVPDRGPVLLNAFYTVNLGLFVYFLARTCYTWRSLVFFRAQPRTRQEWRWFEVLLGASLLFRLVSGDTTSWVLMPVLLGLAGLGVYLSAHQQWIAYLNRRQKWEIVFLQLAILGVMAVFVVYFLNLQNDPQLAGPLAQHAFLVLTSFFAGFYAVMGFLVTLFNLPTAGVFEQKREEILSMQRLSQLIQKGQSEKEVYSLLFDSAVQTVEADAAWLDLDTDNDGPGFSYRVDAGTREGICRLLADYNIGHIEYLNNDLPNSAGFRALELPYGSLIVMPLRSTKHHYGTLYLLKETRQGFDRENLSLLQIFTNQTVLSIENLRLLQESLQSERVKEELKIASLVQESLIPKTLPADSWFEIRWHSLPAREVGGDFYDFLQLSASRIAIIIGDVSGKGTTAAFHVAQMKGIFHSLMLLDKPERGQPLQPSKFMAMANQALSHCLERSSFITASFYIVDYKERGFAFARAGHCHTLYYNAITEETFYFQTEGLGLGILRDGAAYEKRIKNMYYDYNPGDVMVMYTDGIVEARNAQEEEYGEDRLRKLLERSHYLEAEDIKQSIIRDLEEFSRGLPPFDDQTLLVIKFKNAQPLA